MLTFPIPVLSDSQFPIDNIPFGIFSPPDQRKRAATIIGDYVVDLAELESHGCFPELSSSSRTVFSQDYLNEFAARPPSVRRQVRETIISLLSKADSELFTNIELNRRVFHHAQDVHMHLPMHITEFTDFSAAEEHVRNCFAMSNMKFDPETTNFYHNPIGYTARCSSLVPSRTKIPRPNGMYKDAKTGYPMFQPTQKLDYELELGFFISNPVPFGQLVSPDRALEHIFGFVLFNDWSARDVQMYESFPVGPINSKAFATTISPWVTMPEALSFAATAPYKQVDGQAPLHILHASVANQTYDINCHAHLARGSTGKLTQLSHSNLKHMYFTPGQLLAHRASTGCGLVTGELIGMGTVSSPESEWPDPSKSRAGCLFEMTWDGTKELPSVGGKWLEDGDTVVLRAWARGPTGSKIGFGDVQGTIISPLKLERDYANKV